MKRKLKHLLVIRFITGIVLFFFGFFHLLDNTNFISLLRITNLPLVEFNPIFIPLSDLLVGIFLILGLFYPLCGNHQLLHHCNHRLDLCHCHADRSLKSP